jgi:hypothetical protein
MFQETPDDCIHLGGVDFQEFARVFMPATLVCLRHGHTTGKVHTETGLSTVLSQEYPALCPDDSGNLDVLDAESTEALDRLTPQDVAEMLYLSHLKRPIRSPFLDNLNNRFAFLSHDDGWYCKVYFKDPKVFFGAVPHLIENKLQDLGVQCGSDDSKSDCGRFQRLSSEGLHFDLTAVRRSGEGRVEIPVFVFGKMHAPYSTSNGFGMDDLMNDQAHFTEKARLMKCHNEAGRWFLSV